MYIVVQYDITATGRDGVIIEVHGCPDVGGVGIVLRINVGMDDMITQVIHHIQAGTTAIKVRRAHVSWIFPNRAADCTLDLGHLAGNIGIGERRQVRVGPGVGSNLVALVIHSRDESLVSSSRNWFTPVLAVDKEGRLYAVA